MSETPNVEYLGIYGILIRAGYAPATTTFVTTCDSPQQVGHIVYKQGDSIPKHYHKPVERRITGTTEVLIIQHGKCVVTFYDGDRAPVLQRTLNAGDLLLIMATDGSGHGFDMLEDTTILEIKQGPYTGEHEKVRF
jgi:quercetin dioxygenase-like cupin family protein